ncbi:MAG: aminoacyl-tRNA hydrolase [Gemmatimonas sp.]|nr:aminoacyl-tRNA hydrolase [Gemmatimonas sp.]
MQLVVGLGNPGERYAWTRHNLGFRVLDALAARARLRFGPVRDGCATAAGRLGAGEVVLVKPVLYMNRSGEALAARARAEGWPLQAGAPPPESAGDPGAGETAPGPPPSAGPPPSPMFPPPLAVCDDIALPWGSLRLRAGGSDGGHRGLESLGRALGGTRFPRLRLGVDGSETGIPPPEWADYVLAEFDAAERAAAEDLVQDACEVLLTWLEHGLETAAGRHNRRGGRA